MGAIEGDDVISLYELVLLCCLLCSYMMFLCLLLASGMRVRCVELVRLLMESFCRLYMRISHVEGN